VVAAVPPAPTPPTSAPTPPVVTEKLPDEREIAQIENAEPVSEAQAEAIGPQLVASEQSPLSADPSDYSIAADFTIEVQAAETIGHIAEWLDTRASELRKLNKMRGTQPVIVGRRLKIDLAHVSVEEFERRRRAYHQNLQEEFFASNRIAGTEIHIVRRGESLWSIALKFPRTPIWLLRQHNPDLDFDDVRPGTQLVLPLVQVASTTPEDSP
jgi:membrane-bound lytic murein transglycosylase D